MAEFLVAARDLPSGYIQGDPITVKPNGWTWGAAEGLPDFWQIVVTDLPYTMVEPYMAALHEVAQPGDPELSAPDEADRRIYRHRRPIRVIFEDLPPSWQNDLTTTGRLEVTVVQIRSRVRKLRWNRSLSSVEVTAEEAF